LTQAAACPSSWRHGFILLFLFPTLEPQEETKNHEREGASPRS